jgi:protein TonB
MRYVPVVLIVAAAVACSSFRDKLRPQPTPAPQSSPTIMDVPPTPAVGTSPTSVPVEENVRTISGGVLNGKAVSLPQPDYPPAAKAVHASGTVNVQVAVNTSGGVESATAVSGHPLLRAAAVAAARQAKFSPTLLAGKPVKVTGVVTYKFTP